MSAIRRLLARPSFPVTPSGCSRRSRSCLADLPTQVRGARGESQGFSIRTPIVHEYDTAGAVPMHRRANRAKSHIIPPPSHTYTLSTSAAVWDAALERRPQNAPPPALLEAYLKEHVLMVGAGATASSGPAGAPLSARGDLTARGAGVARRPVTARAGPESQRLAAAGRTMLKRVLLTVILLDRAVEGGSSLDPLGPLLFLPTAKCKSTAEVWSRDVRGSVFGNVFIVPLVRFSCAVDALLRSPASRMLIHCCAPSTLNPPLKPRPAAAHEHAQSRA